MHRRIQGRHRAYALIVTGLLLIPAGCGTNRRKDAIALSDRPAYASRGDEGSISGKILFDGTPPDLEPILMTADAACAAAGESKPENIVVNDGRLKNVFVFLRGAAVDGYRFPIGGPVALDQKNCRYVPHVVGVQVGQTVRITNGDQTNHNVHPTPTNNSGFNQEQTPGDPPIDHVFDAIDVMIPVRCNQHPWMKASIGVLGHPFFAVSGDDGTFRIDHIPPGDYTLVFWHEVYGEQNATVSVSARAAVTKDATFRPGGSANPATLLGSGPPFVIP